MVQGCQMVYLHTKASNFGTFWKALGWKMLVHFMTIWYIFGHFVYFKAIWYISRPFGIFMAIWSIFWLFWHTYFSPFRFIVPRKIWQPCSGDLVQT
jgi:hypothetical protein